MTLPTSMTIAESPMDDYATDQLAPIVVDDPLADPEHGPTSHDFDSLPGSPHDGRRWRPEVPNDPSYIGRHRIPEGSKDPKTLTGVLLSAIGVRR